MNTRNPAIFLALCSLAAAASARAGDELAFEATRFGARPPPPPVASADASAPYAFELGWVLDIMHVDGASDGTRTLGLLDASLAVDLDRLWSGSRTEFVAHAIAVRGGAPNALADTAQGIDNLEVANDEVKLYEVYVDRRYGARDASLRAGLYDLNTELYVQDAAGLFVNPSHGIGPELAQSGRGGPSIYPNAAVGVRLKLQPSATSYALVAVLDGVPGAPDDGDEAWMRLSREEGALVAAEVGVGGASAHAALGRELHLAIGAWHYSAEFEHVTSAGDGALVRKRDNHGAYALVDADLWHADGGSPRRLRGFVRGGVANGDINPVDRYLGGGLVLEAPFARRGDDSIGIGFGWVHGADGERLALRAAGDAPSASERIVELTWRFQLSPHLALQPNLQHLAHPGFLAGDWAWALGLRVELTL